MHSTGDCTAVRTRLPVPGVIPDSPASNGWKPGFMTDLMAKDLDLALAYAARAGVPSSTTATARQALTAASTAGFGREDFSAVAKVVLRLAGVAVTGGRSLAPGAERRRGCTADGLGAGGDPGRRPPCPGRDDRRAVRVVRRRPRRRPAVLRRHPGQHPAPAGPGGVGGGRAPARGPTCRSTAPGWPAARSSSTTGWWRAWSGRRRRMDRRQAHDAHRPDRPA